MHVTYDVIFMSVLLQTIAKSQSSLGNFNSYCTISIRYSTKVTVLSILWSWSDIDVHVGAKTEPKNYFCVVIWALDSVV